MAAVPASERMQELQYEMCMKHNYMLLTPSGKDARIDRASADARRTKLLQDGEHALRRGDRGIAQCLMTQAVLGLPFRPGPPLRDIQPLPLMSEGALQDMAKLLRTLIY